jgi:multidrug resistance efflux pump
MLGRNITSKMPAVVMLLRKRGHRTLSRAAFLGVSVLLLARVGAAEDELPQRREGKPLDFEPNLQLLEVEGANQVEARPEEPVLDLQKAKAALENAKRKQQRWQQLARRGVLSKVEAESTELQVARATARYEQARVAQQRRELEALRKRAAAGELSAGLVQAAEAALASSTALAAEAAASLKRTQVLLAETNVQRQRQLHAAGLGSRNQLQRAEATLRQLQATAAVP